MTKLTALLAVVGALSLAIAGAALAVPPVQETDSQDYSGSSSCGSFDDVFVGHLDAHLMTTFDQAGNPVRDILHFNGWETNYRSDMPSVSITGHRSFTVMFDYSSGIERDIGNIFTQTFPGQGVLFHDVGLISFLGPNLLTIHGPHDIFDQGEAAYCNGLIAATPN